MGIETDSVPPYAEYKPVFDEFFQKNPPTFAKSEDSTQMSVGGTRYYYDNYDSIIKIFPPEYMVQRLLPFFQKQPHEQVDIFKQYITATFRRDLAEKKARKADLYRQINGESGDFDLPDPDYIVANLRPARQLGDKSRESGFLFIDKQTKKLTDYDYHSIAFALRRKMDRGMIDEYMAHHVHIRATYDPQAEVGIEKCPDSNNVYAYNRYEPPAWKALRKEVEPGLDEDIRALMAHLFPRERCREFVYSWIYHSLKGRAGTYLYLCSAQATGKNTLASLISALHGSSNSSNPKQDSFKSRFNYYLRDKTFIFFDEFNCRVRQDKDILKSIANKRIQVEGKGRDHEDIDLHCSFMLTNNSLEAIGLDPVDRRFSVPAITDEPIVPVFGRDRIRALLKKFEDDTFLARFGFWILENHGDSDWLPEEPYQTERFEDIVIATARLGIGETLTKLMNSEQSEYHYSDERDAFRRLYKGQNYPNIADWQKFFRDVERDGKSVCKVEGPKLIPEDRYMPNHGGDLD